MFLYRSLYLFLYYRETKKHAQSASEVVAVLIEATCLKLSGCIQDCSYRLPYKNKNCSALALALALPGLAVVVAIALAFFFALALVVVLALPLALALALGLLKSCLCL